MREWTDLFEEFSESNLTDVGEYLQRQRWFAAKDRAIVGLSLVDFVILQEQPLLVLAIIESRFGGGASHMYQFVLRANQPSQLTNDDLSFVTSMGQLSLHDASDHPLLAKLVARAPEGGTSISSGVGEVTFQSIVNLVGDEMSTRHLGADQSNTSIVFNEALLIKLYRHLEAGINPEFEMLLFLTEHDFPNVPELTAWYSYSGNNLRATLGLAQQFKSDSTDGWNLGLEEVPRSPQQFLARIERLGSVIAQMHGVLGSDRSDPDFAPDKPTPETSAILSAQIEEQIDKLAHAIPEGCADDLRLLAQSLGGIPPAGRTIRTHGDLHLGQVLWDGGDWYVIDFEGEPIRSLVERRKKYSPLRDVAGMLRSFAYLTTALRSEKGVSLAGDWELQARALFLKAYREQISKTSLLPPDEEVQDRTIRLFELEKVLYELDYETQNRPAWLAVPLAGIDRLLRESTE